MCGIFGIISSGNLIRTQIEILAEKALRRGSDASGMLVFKNEQYSITRSTENIKRLVKQAFDGGSNVFLGHSRLVTNDNINNQPVYRDGIAVFHNGIIVNHKDIAEKYGFHLELEIDTEIIALLFRKGLSSGNLEDAVNLVLTECRGTISAAVFLAELGKCVLVTNHGSLYYALAGDTTYFGSERSWFEQFVAQSNIIQLGKKEFEIFDVPVTPGVISEFNVGAEYYNYLAELKEVTFDATLLQKLAVNVPMLRRCSKCILPETMPFIVFNDSEVCNYCMNWRRRTDTLPLDSFQKSLEVHRLKYGDNNCIVPFSGGRDSCYALHLIVKELGLNPITYTYDWGMNTDLGRRNISRMCDQLGVENIVVAADIKKKRNNIRKNLLAWLRRPHLGMLNLLTAGDKHFFQYIDSVREETGISLNIWGFNPLETTHFKTGFLGMPPDFLESKVYSTGIRKQLKYHCLRLAQFARNPRYINTSLWDTYSGEYYRSVNKKSDYFQVFDFFRWDEKEINELLIRDYDWEMAPDTISTWRIGDGSAAFYNYVYFALAGFSEHDTFRSNQIREGVIDRERALSLVEQENQPRVESIKWYLEVLGLDFEMVIDTINRARKIWEVNEISGNVSLDS